MKKILILLFCICALIFTSCAKDNPIYLSYFGQSRENVFKELKLSEKNATKSKYPGEWLLEKSETVFDREYSVSLNFEHKTDNLYGFYYYSVISDFKDEDYEYIKDLVKKISEQYGEPDTYPGVGNRITNINGIDDLKKGNRSTYTESWDIPKLDDTVVDLNVVCIDKSTIRIEVRYQIAKYPTE